MPSIDLLRRLQPGSALECYWKNSIIDDVNDRYPHMVLAFTDSGNKVTATCTFRITSAVSSISFKWRWKAPGTTGNVVWDLEYRAIAAGESMDPSSDQEALSVTDAHAGTALVANDATVAATAGNFASGDTVMVAFSRDTSDASDTMTGVEALLEEFWVEWS